MRGLGVRVEDLRFRGLGFRGLRVSCLGKYGAKLRVLGC